MKERRPASLPDRISFSSIDSKDDEEGPDSMIGPKRRLGMRRLLLLTLILLAGCSKSAIRHSTEDDPRDTRTEAQKLEDRLGV